MNNTAIVKDNMITKTKVNIITIIYENVITSATVIEENLLVLLELISIIELKIITLQKRRKFEEEPVSSQ